MTQEEKDLLIKDLSARLPYGVKVLTYKLDYIHNPSSIETLYEINEDGYISTVESDTLRPIGKPYLRPMSSMTRVEILEYISLKESIVASDNITYSFETYESIDWLNKNHFDYRGLIEKGLAIDATNLNVY